MARYSPRILTTAINMALLAVLSTTTTASTVAKHGLWQAASPRDTAASVTDRIRNNPIFRQLHGFVARKNAASSSEGDAREFASNRKFLPYADKRIDEVRIVRLKIFGQSVYDTLMTPTPLERFGNSLRITTSKRVIAKNLLFKEGDSVKPVDFAETEELLRSLPYIEDANIMLEMLADTSRVRAIVVTKDNWTLGFSFSSSSLSKGEYSLSESNLAGTGFSADATVFYDQSHPDRFARMGELEYANIGGTFVTANLWARRGLDRNFLYTNLNRDFFASKTKMAGGITYYANQEPYSAFRADTVFPIDYNLLDWWLGHSFRVSRKNSLDAPYNLTLAFKHRKIDFDKAIEVTSDSNYHFHSTGQWLVSLGLTNQSLFQSSLIYSFGSTEDIPVGFKVQLASGVERSRFSQRILVNGEMSAAEVTPMGYLYLSFRMGSYWAEGGRLEQGVINIRSTYMTNLLSLGRSDMRQFIQYDYTRGIARFKGEREYITLEDRYGIRGLSSNALTGEVRAMLNLETNVFTPLYLFGFRFAYFFFCDLGIVGPADELLLSQPIYSGLGLGVRFKNENLIFPAFVVRLGYYPRIPDNADVAHWLISTERRRRFENFRIREPYILPYE